MNPLRKPLVFVLLLFLLSSAVSALETAEGLFNRVSEHYKAIQDYSAKLVITKGENIQKANIFFKMPGMLYLEFTQPDGMIMSVYENVFSVWVPSYAVIFSQKLSETDPGEVPPAIMGSRGLDIIKRYYTVSYTSTPDLVKLRDNSNEMVYKLKAVWKSSNEGFRRLELAIGRDLLLKQIKGITTANKEIQFDISEMEINRGIPDQRFKFESPATGNVIDNFLFETEK